MQVNTLAQARTPTFDGGRGSGVVATAPTSSATPTPAPKAATTTPAPAPAPAKPCTQGTTRHRRGSSVRPRHDGLHKRRGGPRLVAPRLLLQRRSRKRAAEPAAAVTQSAGHGTGAERAEQAQDDKRRLALGGPRRTGAAPRPPPLPRKDMAGRHAASSLPFVSSSHARPVLNPCARNFVAVELGVRRRACPT